MPLTQDEKEALADRVVAIVRAQEPESALSSLRVKVESGDEGEDGMNSAVLAIATAIFRQGILIAPRRSPER
jgi:hypothetical protein